MAVSTGAAILGSAAIGALSSGGKKGSTTTTSMPNRWQGEVMANASNIFNNPVYNYRGPMLSPGATNNLQATIRGDYLNPQSNPFLGQYVNDALGLAKSNFAGQYGGRAGGNLGNSGYQEMLMRTLANTALPIYANAYGAERQNQLQASQLAQSVDTGNVQAPFTELMAFKNAVDGGGGGSVSQPFFTNPAAGALGGGLLGMQLAGALNQQSPAPLIQGMVPGQYSLINSQYG